MTTTVNVCAHCDPATTQVRIIVGDMTGVTKRVEKIILLDGESHELAVYGDLYVSVDEIPI